MAATTERHKLTLMIDHQCFWQSAKHPTKAKRKTAPGHEKIKATECCPSDSKRMHQEKVSAKAGKPVFGALKAHSELPTAGKIHLSGPLR
jgi:hypothetical protein